MLELVNLVSRTVWVVVQQDLQLVRAEHDYDGLHRHHHHGGDDRMVIFTCVCGLTELEQSPGIVSEEPADRIFFFQKHCWIKFSQIRLPTNLQVTLLTMECSIESKQAESKGQMLLPELLAQKNPCYKILKHSCLQLSWNYSQSNH